MDSFERAKQARDEAERAIDGGNFVKVKAEDEEYESVNEQENDLQLDVAEAIAGMGKPSADATFALQSIVEEVNYDSAGLKSNDHLFKDHDTLENPNKDSKTITSVDLVEKQSDRHDVQEGQHDKVEDLNPSETMFNIEDEKKDQKKDPQAFGAGQEAEETESYPNQESIQKSDKFPELPPHLASVPHLDVLSIECQKFLIDIKMFTASEFLASDRGELADKYSDWRTKIDPSATIATGSGRIYMNKWRKRLKDAIEQTGIQSIDGLGEKFDYVVAFAERVYHAENEKKRGHTPTPSANQGPVAHTPKRPGRPRKSATQPLKTTEEKKSDIPLISLTLNEPGTFGLKVENTLSNGVRISDVIPGLQGAKAGFQKGDIVASATMGGDSVDENTITTWAQDMAFDDFVKIAQSTKRPINVQVRRGVLNEELVQKKKSSPTDDTAPRKRGRPRKGEVREKRGREVRKRIKPSEAELRKFEIKTLRKIRENLILANDINIAADVIERSITRAIYDNALAKKNIQNTVQIMREEAEELWNNPLFGDWEERFKELLEFKRRNGHVKVPRNYPNKELNKFLSSMKASQKAAKNGEYKKTKRKERAKMEIELLEQIGFSWRTSSKATKTWNDYFRQLEEYKAEHGTCVVPKTKRQNETRNLALWVILQRRKYHRLLANPEVEEKKAGRLNESQIKRLTDLGMVWELGSERSFDEYFEDLLEYKLRHGDCKVPQNYNDSKGLGSWVSRMRRQKKIVENGEQSDVLTDERIKMMNDIGFVWDARTSPRKRRAHSTDESFSESSDDEVDGSPVNRMKKNFHSNSIEDEDDEDESPKRKKMKILYATDSEDSDTGRYESKSEIVEKRGSLRHDLLLSTSQVKKELDSADNSNIELVPGREVDFDEEISSADGDFNEMKKNSDEAPGDEVGSRRPEEDINKEGEVEYKRVVEVYRMDHDEGTLPDEKKDSNEVIESGNTALKEQIPDEKVDWTGYKIAEGIDL